MKHDVTATWDPELEVFRPTPRYARHCREVMEEDEVYLLEVGTYASEQTRRHYFATLRELYDNLPERFGNRWGTFQIFRKHCLIKTGFYNERQFPMSTEDDAFRLAAALAPQSYEDDYAIITVEGTVVIEWKAKSQKRRAMPGDEFNRSKQAVLEYAETLIGTKEMA